MDRYYVESGFEQKNLIDGKWVKYVDVQQHIVALLEEQATQLADLQAKHDLFITEQWNKFISALHMAVDRPSDGLDWGELVDEVLKIKRERDNFKAALDRLGGSPPPAATITFSQLASAQEARIRELEDKLEKVMMAEDANSTELGMIGLKLRPEGGLQYSDICFEIRKLQEQVKALQEKK